MVTALSRKELDRTIIEQLNLYLVWGRKNTEKNKTSQDNFPYALREFINSHIDLPTFEEIISNQNKSALRMNMAR